MGCNGVIAVSMTKVTTEKKQCEQCGKERMIAAYRKLCAGCRHFNCDVSKGRVRKPDYPDTTVAGYKEPMQKVKDGFGYYGAITSTKDGEHIQCHICGYFYKNLGCHVRWRHEVAPRDYRFKYGLRLTEGLLSDSERKRAQARYNATNRKTTADYAAMSAKGAVVMKAKGIKLGGPSWSAQTRNEKGMCKEQTIAKIQRLAALNEGVAIEVRMYREYGYGQRDVIKHWFGSWEEAVKQAEVIGLKEARVKRKVEYRRDVLTKIKDFYKKYGRTPQTADFNSLDIFPAQKDVSRVFGSLNTARRLAGVPELVKIGREWVEISL